MSPLHCSDNNTITIWDSGTLDITYIICKFCQMVQNNMANGKFEQKIW